MVDILLRLPHRVVVQQSTVTATGGGTFLPTWSTSSVQWANVQPISAKETYEARKGQMEITHRVIMRSMTLDNSKRIKYGSRILWIETVTDPTERGRMIEVMAREEKGET